MHFTKERCMHANYIGPNETEVKGEAELLMPPYSGFEIKSVPNFDDPPPTCGYYTVVLAPKHDNRGSESVPETAPVATWH
eukprot:4711192-Prymnesium_polylepis.3